MPPALQLLPAWFPSDEVMIGLIVFIAAVVLMNRGRWWVVNVLAQDEPLLLAIGVTVVALALSGRIGDLLVWIGQMAGMDALVALSGGGNALAFAIGGGLAVAAVYVYRSDRYDISGLI